MLLVHSSVDGHLGCFHLLAIVNNAINMVCKCEILLNIYPEVQLNHMVNLFFKFLRNCQIASLFYISTNSAQELQFSTSSPTLTIFCFSHISHPNGCRVISHWFICIYIIIIYVEHLFICCLDICMLAFEKCLFKTVAF